MLRCFSSSKNFHERSTKPHNTRPLSVIGWINVYCGSEWLVVPLVIVCDLGAQAVLQRCVFLTSCLRGGQLADQEDRSEERERLYSGRESLIQPLKAAKVVCSINIAAYIIPLGSGPSAFRSASQNESALRNLMSSVLHTNTQ